MIDTVVITLTREMFSISQPEKFYPSAIWMSDNKNYYSSIYSRQNPTKTELKLGIYKPRLTISNKISGISGYVITLRIELSLPKLFFGNNFAELRLKDFLPLTEKIVKVLSEMGVVTTVDILSNAQLSMVHYSKNIKLTDGSIPYHYIQKIKEANVKLSLDVNQTDYRNEGHSYKWHSNSYEVVFYDKIKDLEKAKTSVKKSIEKDSELQLHLFNKLQKRHMLEILRIEVRLNKRAKIKQLLSTLGIKQDLTFKKLFKPAISKKVLLHYLDEIETKRPILLDYKITSNRGLLADLIFNNPDFSTNKILQLYGLKQALTVMNIRELRTMFAGHNKRSWHRLMSDVNKVNLPNAQNPFKVIREQLEKFERIRDLTKQQTT